MATALSDITIPCANAAEFLAYLRPSASHWRTRITSKLRWIFRGQQSSAWGLTPPIWRADSGTKEQISILSGFTGESLSSLPLILDRCRLYVPSRIADANESTESELRMLQEYVAHVNLAGLNFPHETLNINWANFGFAAVPKDTIGTDCCGFAMRQSPFFDRVLSRFKIDLPTEHLQKIPKELHGANEGWPYFTNFQMNHPIVALAQHHGIPTRLLDWSHDSRKAAFFAAWRVPVPERSDASQSIAVWAINPFMLENRFLGEQTLSEKIEDDLSVEVFLSQHRIYAEKNQTTSYLAAQEGLFTYPLYADLFYIFTGMYPDVLISLTKMREWEERYTAKDASFFPAIDYIRKVTLPFTQADELLEMLDDERVMLTTLMPSLDKMKQCMIERASRKRRLEHGEN